MMRALVVSLLAGSLILLIVSCGKKGVPPDGTSQYAYLEIISGNNQTAAAGTLLTDSILIRVMNSIGVPVIGDTVTFTQISQNDGGQVTYAQRLTNNLGYARTFYRLDTLIGVDTIKVSASSVDDTGAVFFIMTAVVGPADTLIKVSPTGTLTHTAGQPLPDPVVVRVTDQYGNPVAGDSVFFKTDNRCIVVTDSSIQHPFETDSAFTISDADGLAQATWVLTINPDPDWQTYPNFRPSMIVANGTSDTVRFFASATDPGTLEYYYDIRPILAENCFVCHSNPGTYRVDYYYELDRNGYMVPGDSACSLVVNSDPNHHLAININTVEEDKIFRWVVADMAAPGSSGLNNYSDNMKSIIDASCLSCHLDPLPPAGYKMATHAEIRGTGETDTIPNAIAGDTTSAVVIKMKQRHNWTALDPDSLAAAVLADSIIIWVVDDSLRQY